MPWLADRQEIPEGAVVLQAQVADATELFFQPLLLGQPGVLVIELIAQAIQ